MGEYGFHSVTFIIEAAHHKIEYLLGRKVNKFKNL